MVETYAQTNSSIRPPADPKDVVTCPTADSPLGFGKYKDIFLVDPRYVRDNFGDYVLTPRKGQSALTLGIRNEARFRVRPDAAADETTTPRRQAFVQWLSTDEAYRIYQASRRKRFRDSYDPRCSDALCLFTGGLSTCVIL